jgi:NitT/TauT family transport system permease protein/sulfonate transport system permease protein
MRVEQESFTSAFAERLIGEAIVLLALLSWWFVARGLPEFVLPGPVVVVRRLIELFAAPEFLWNAFASSWRVLVSIAAALLIGGGLAFLAHGEPWLAGVVDAGSSQCSTRFLRSAGRSWQLSGSTPAILASSLSRSPSSSRSA